MYTVEYYSTTRKKEILPFVTWVDLEGIIVSKINHLFVKSKKNEFIESENRLKVARSRR